MVTSSVVIFITINIIKVPKLEDLVKKKKKNRQKGKSEIEDLNRKRWYLNTRVKENFKEGEFDHIIPKTSGTITRFSN